MSISLAAQPAGTMASFTATTANVSGAPDAIHVDLFRWSTDAERDHIATAWEKPAAPAAAAGARGGGAARAGRGGPAQVAKLTPDESLAAALQETPTVGYLWSSEAAGYALRYAGKLPAAGGGERIILMTDRRLGKSSGLWSPAAGTPGEEDFSVIEVRVNARGEGEGRISLTDKLTVDSAAKVPVPAGYDSLPVVLKNVKLRAASK